MITAIIFDLDGTLVDTLPVYMAAYTKVINDHFNIKPEEECIEKRFGTRATELMAGLLEDIDVDPKTADVGELINGVRDEVVSKIEEIVIMPGVYKILDKLHGKYKLGLATSSRPYAAHAILKKFKLERYFDVVVTGEKVEHSKPHPDIFLMAAEGLGVKPEECIVIEDAVYGINAAKAAGMKSIGVGTGICTREELEASGPDFLIDSLEGFDLDILK